LGSGVVSFWQIVVTLPFLNLFVLLKSGSAVPGL
jgi:hypothetical protein